MVSNCRLTSQPYRTRHLPQKEERLLVHDRRIACGRTLWLRYSAADVMKDTVHGLGVEEADTAVGEVCELGLVLQRHNPHARQRGLWSHTGGSAPVSNTREYAEREWILFQAGVEQWDNAWCVVRCPVGWPAASQAH